MLVIPVDQPDALPSCSFEATTSDTYNKTVTGLERTENFGSGLECTPRGHWFIFLEFGSFYFLTAKAFLFL